MDPLENAIQDLIKELQNYRKSIRGGSTTSSTPTSGGSGGGSGGSGNDPDNRLSRVTRFASDSLDGLGTASSSLIKSMVRGGTEFTDVTGIFTGGLSKAGTLLGKLPGKYTKMFQVAGEALGGTADDFMKYVQDNVVVYRELSKVGLALGGDIGQLSQLAGKANMALGPFAQLIGTNKDLLLGFSEGLDGGTKYVSKMLNQFSDLSEGAQNFQRDLMSTGLTLEESNDVFLRNLLIQRRTNLMSNKTEEEAAKSAADLAKNMSDLSKLTGEDVKSIQDKILKEQMAGDNALLIRELEAQGFAEAGNAHADIVAQLGMLGPEFVQMFHEYAKFGTLVTQESKDFANANRETSDMVFGSAMAFVNGSADEAKALSEGALQVGLEYQRSAEFMQMGQKAMLGGPYQAAMKSFENTQLLQRRIDAILAENPSMTMADAIKQMMEDAKEQTTKQIEEGRKDSALGTVNAIEQQATQAISRLNETAGAIVSESENLFESVKQVAEESIKAFTSVSVFALETISSTNKEYVDDFNDFKGQFIKTKDGEQVKITDELLRKLDKYIDPTTSEDEKLELKKEFQAQGIVDNEGDFNTVIPIPNIENIEILLSKLESGFAFGSETKQIISNLENAVDGTVDIIENQFPEIYKKYKSWFEEQRKSEDDWKKAGEQVQNNNTQLMKNDGRLGDNTQQDTDNSNQLEETTQLEVEGTGINAEVTSPVALSISETMISAEVTGIIDLPISADQISISSPSTTLVGSNDFEPGKFLEKMQGMSKQESTVVNASSSSTNQLDNSLEFEKFVTELSGQIGKTNEYLQNLVSTTQNYNLSMMNRLDSLIGVNMTITDLSRTHVRKMDELIG